MKRSQQAFDRHCWGRVLKSSNVPHIAWMQLQYNKTGQVACVASSTSFSASPANFKLNSIYHIDGTQNVMGYTNHTAQYWKYKVYAVDCEIIFFDPEVDNMWVAALLTGPGETKDLSDFNTSTIGQLGNCAWAPLPQYGGQKVVFKRRIPIADALGVTRAQHAADTDVVDGSAAFIGSSPTTFCLMRLGAATADSHNISVNATYQINLTLHVQMYNRKTEIL